MTSSPTIEVVKKFSTEYEVHSHFIHTTISGVLDTPEIHLWAQSLAQTLESVADGSRFKILVDMFGFKAANFPAHKVFRSIIPQTLANYSWKVGYLALFEEDAQGLEFTCQRGIRCVAAAHVHQDASKITLYQNSFGTDNEKFFSNPEKALKWIRSISV